MLKGLLSCTGEIQFCNSVMDKITIRTTHNVPASEDLLNISTFKLRVDNYGQVLEIRQTKEIKYINRTMFIALYFLLVDL